MNFSLNLLQLALQFVIVSLCVLLGWVIGAAVLVALPLVALWLFVSTLRDFFSAVQHGRLIRRCLTGR